MQKFGTIHIFGYGETQLIAEKSNKKLKSSQLTNLQALVDEVWAKKPADSDASQAYHAINIFHGMFVDFQPKSGKGFRTPIAQISDALVDAVIDEINTLLPSTSTTTTTTTAQ